MYRKKLRSWNSRKTEDDIIEPKTTIEDLPEEILLEVLSYIDKGQLLSTIPLVNRRWKALHDDASLYRTLKFEKENPTTDVAIKLISMAPLLTSLVMIDRTDTDKLLPHVGPNHPRLVKLHLRNCRVPRHRYPVPSSQIINIVSNCTQLQNLSLEHTICEDSLFCEAIGLMIPNLRILDVGILEEDTAISVLTLICNNCTKIEEIRKSDPWRFVNALAIPEETVNAFFLRCRESLSVFGFGNCVVWSDALLASVAKCLHLKELKLLRAQNITDQGLMEISMMSNLRDLSLEGADNITARCMITFFQNPSIRKLQTLSLASKNIDFRVLNAIVIALRDLVQLSIRGETIFFRGSITMPNQLDSTICELDQTPPQVGTSSLQTPLFNDLMVNYRNINQILHVVSSMRNLVRLVMYKPTNEAIMAISLLPKLLELELNTGHQVTKERWIELFESPCKTRLRHLTLGYCHTVDDAVACCIATNLRQLQVLCIHTCKVTKKGQINITQMVSEQCEVHFVKFASGGCG